MSDRGGAQRRARGRTADRRTPGTLIGAGKEAEVFARRPDVLKLYRQPTAKAKAFREAATLAQVEPFGLPAPTVHGVEMVDGRWGLTMTKVDGPSFADQIIGKPDRAQLYLTAMASLHARIHQNPAARFPGMKARLGTNIAQATVLDEPSRRRLRDGLGEMPEADRLCHGDFHPLNILGPIGEATVVDWLDACSGDPAADVCRSYVLMQPHVPELASRYVDVYAELAGVSREAILRWLPFVAAARLAEGVPDETAGLMEMAYLR